MTQTATVLVAQMILSLVALILLIVVLACRFPAIAEITISIL